MIKTHIQFKAEQKKVRRAREAELAAELNEKESKLRVALSKQEKDHSYANRLDHRHQNGQDGGPSLAAILTERAPRLLDSLEYVNAINTIAGLTPIRPASAWKPKGKGRDSLFRSLITHLFARFPVPPVLFTAFFDPLPGQRDLFAQLATYIMGGGSLYNYLQEDLKCNPNCRISLTRKQCHEFLQYQGAKGFMWAIRGTQIRSFGGTPRLHAAIMGTILGERLVADEPFWQTVLHWFAKNPMLETSQIQPLFDYISRKRVEDREFSMKGRGVLPLLREMEAWHAGLAKERSFTAYRWNPSGFKPAEYDRSPRFGKDKKKIWRINELTSSSELREEGRRMNHCVLSYAKAAAAGQVSIWSLSLENGEGETGNWSMLTLEVHNQAKAVVQARGRFNRFSTAEERSIVREWAGANNLTIKTGTL